MEDAEDLDGGRGFPEPAGEMGTESHVVTNPGFSNENSIIALNTLNTINGIIKQAIKEGITKLKLILSSLTELENVKKCH